MRFALVILLTVTVCVEAAPMVPGLRYAQHGLDQVHQCRRGLLDGQSLHSTHPGKCQKGGNRWCCDQECRLCALSNDDGVPYAEESGLFKGVKHDCKRTVGGNQRPTIPAINSHARAGLGECQIAANPPITISCAQNTGGDGNLVKGLPHTIISRRTKGLKD